MLSCRLVSLPRQTFIPGSARMMVLLATKTPLPIEMLPNTSVNGLMKLSLIATMGGLARLAVPSVASGLDSP